MKYAKLIDNTLQYAPKVLRVDGKTYINPNAETLKAHGYYPVVETERPTADDGYVVTSVGYALEGDTIIRKWQVKPKPVPTEEELAELRRQAYITECDPLSMAYIGYMLEGEEAKADLARMEYLTRKAEIRAKHSS